MPFQFTPAERREPTPKDFADPRFDVIWNIIKTVETLHSFTLQLGATGNDVCAILDKLDRVKDS